MVRMLLLALTERHLLAWRWHDIFYELCFENKLRMAVAPRKAATLRRAVAMRNAATMRKTVTLRRAATLRCAATLHPDALFGLLLARFILPLSSMVQDVVM